MDTRSQADATIEALDALLMAIERVAEAVTTQDQQIADLAARVAELEQRPTRQRWF